MYNVSLFLGDVGGIYSTIVIVFSSVASLFSDKLASVKRAERFYKVSRTDPYFESSSQNSIIERYKYPQTLSNDKDEKLTEINSLIPLSVPKL